MHGETSRTFYPFISPWTPEVYKGSMISLSACSVRVGLNRKLKIINEDWQRSAFATGATKWPVNDTKIHDRCVFNTSVVLHRSL